MERRLRSHSTDQSFPPFVRAADALPPLVGRSEELGRLEEALGRAVRGQGSAVFLTGPAGIGKTRLAEKAISLAIARGFVTLSGRSYPLETDLAYAPVLGAFRPLLRSFDPPRLQALVDGLPELGRLFAGLRLPAPEPLGDPGLEKTRLFDAVALLLERLTKEKPVVLFLDDLHWADHASLEMLQYLTRGLVGQRVLLVATYLTDVLDGNRGLRSLVRSMLRAGVARELVLASLDSESVAVLAGGVLASEAPSSLLSLLELRAGGIPLFVTEIIGALIDGGQLTHSGTGWSLDASAQLAVPPTVKHLILDRLTHLEALDRRVLDLIAVAGDNVSHHVLQSASGLEEEVLLAAIHRLAVGGLVAEEVAGPEVTYCLSHPLIGEVAYGELPEIARRRAHGAIVGALERLRPGDWNRLARHYRGAGPEIDRDKALAVFVAAGEQAAGLYANEEAARHFGTALNLAREGRHSVTGPAYARPLLPWLLERLGEAWGQTGEGGAAVAVWAEALAERQRIGDTIGVARLRYRLAVAEWDRGHFDAAQSHIDGGLAALVGQAPCQELVELYYARSGFSARLGDTEAVEDAALKLLSVATELGSPSAEARALIALSHFHRAHRETAKAKELAERALELAESAGELAIAHRVHDVLVMTAFNRGEHRSMRYHAEQELSLARRLGAPSMQVVPLVRLAAASWLAGRWDEARQQCAEAISLARRIDFPRGLAIALGQQALNLSLKGDVDEADRCIVESRTGFGDGSPADRHAFSTTELASAYLALERGRIQHAVVLGQGLVRPSASDGSGGITAAGLPLGFALLAEAQALSGDGDGALQTARSLGSLGPVDSPYIGALANFCEGLARRALGEPSTAVDSFARAAEVFANVELPFFSARARLEYAGLVAPAQPEEAAARAKESLAVFERLGAPRYVERARQLLKSLGVSLQSPRRRPASGQLSNRELQIARLVTEGLSTAEVAERLVVSPRTVTTHLDHIYTRLGISSRTALARYVMEANLLRPEDENT